MYCKHQFDYKFYPEPQTHGHPAAEGEQYFAPPVRQREVVPVEYMYKLISDGALPVRGFHFIYHHNPQAATQYQKSIGKHIFS
jgi:hypothetical protein